MSRLKDIYSKPREKKTKSDVEEVLSIFERYKSIDYARGEAARLAEVALQKFDEISVGIRQDPTKDLARDSISYTMKRSK